MKLVFHKADPTGNVQRLANTESREYIPRQGDWVTFHYDTKTYTGIVQKTICQYSVTDDNNRINETYIDIILTTVQEEK